jgi:hypothetical protein
MSIVYQVAWMRGNARLLSDALCWPMSQFKIDLNGGRIGNNEWQWLANMPMLKIYL